MMRIILFVVFCHLCPYLGGFQDVSRLPGGLDSGGVKTNKTATMSVSDDGSCLG